MVSVDLHMWWASPVCREGEESGSGLGEEEPRKSEYLQSKEQVLLLDRFL